MCMYCAVAVLDLTFSGFQLWMDHGIEHANGVNGFDMQGENHGRVNFYCIITVGVWPVCSLDPRLRT